MIYRHRVRYYETDGMGIVHHSNYIRWMEDARIAFLKEKGLDFHAITEHYSSNSVGFLPVYASCPFRG